MPRIPGTRVPGARCRAWNRAHEKVLVFFDGPAVRVGVVFGGFRGVVFGVKPMPVSDMCVVRGFFVIASFGVLGRFFVVLRSLLMMFCGF